MKIKPPPGKSWADELHDEMDRQQYEREAPRRAFEAERRTLMIELDSATSGDNSLLALAIEAVRNADQEPLTILPERKEK